MLRARRTFSGVNGSRLSVAGFSQDQQPQRLVPEPWSRIPNPQRHEADRLSEIKQQYLALGAADFKTSARRMTGSFFSRTL